MTSESSTPTTTHITIVSNVNFECGKGVVAFNNDIALLEHTNPLHHLMLSFLKNSYTSSNTITFTLSCSSKPLSFELGEFFTITGLKYYENYEALPPKATVKVIAYILIWGLNVGIENILFSGLVAKLVKGKKGREVYICYTRFLSLIFEYLLQENYKNDKLTNFNPHHITAASFNKNPSASKPKAKNDKKSRKKKTQSSSKPKTSTYVRHAKPKKQVDETQHAEEPVATADITKSLDASKSVEEVAN
ncbi:hypothetical protein Tco_0511877 [Tanacetum coccineum]